MSQYICIGGSRHGDVVALIAGQSRHNVILRPAMSFMAQELSIPDVAETLPVETYLLKQLRIRGTQRKLFYLVLSTLGDNESLKMVDEYEQAEDDKEKMSQPSR